MAHSQKTAIECLLRELKNIFRSKKKISDTISAIVKKKRVLERMYQKKVQREAEITNAIRKLESAPKS